MIKILKILMLFSNNKSLYRKLLINFFKKLFKRRFYLIKIFWEFYKKSLLKIFRFFYFFIFRASTIWKKKIFFSNFTPSITTQNSIIFKIFEQKFFFYLGILILFFATPNKNILTVSVKKFNFFPNPTNFTNYRFEIKKDYFFLKINFFPLPQFQKFFLYYIFILFFFMLKKIKFFSPNSTKKNLVRID